MKISVIISTYNQPEYLDLIMQTLVAQEGIAWPDFEIIIADDGSTLETKELIASWQDKLSCSFLHIWHEDDGFRKAVILNKAVVASGGEYLIFIDGDCIMPPDFLAQHLLLCSSGYFVAGNRVLLAAKLTSALFQAKTPFILRWGFWSWLGAKLFGKVNKFIHLLRFNPRAKWRELRKHDWKYPKGCNIGMWRSDYYAVNGFDESFVGWGHEDADLFIRLLHSGVAIKDGRFAAPVYHLWHKQNSRTNEAKNKQLLLEREQSIIVKSLIGVEQYAK